MVVSPHSPTFAQFSGIHGALQKVRTILYCFCCVIKLIVSAYVMINSVNVGITSYVMAIVAKKGDLNKL